MGCSHRADTGFQLCNIGYIHTMLHTFVLALFGFIGIAIKNVFKKHLDDKTKREVAMTVVKAMEQMYADLTGTERYEKAMESMSEMLEQKGIAITELEIKMLIEAAVKEMNTNIKKTEAIANVNSETATKLP